MNFRSMSKRLVQEQVLSKRIVAFSIDMFLASFLYIGMFLLLIPLMRILSKAQMSALISKIDATWTYYSLLFLYFLLQEVFWKKTIGKRILKLEILHKDGKKLRMYQLLIRNIMRVVDLVTIVGLLITLFKSNNQRLGDIIAKTVVVKREQCCDKLKL